MCCPQCLLPLTVFWFCSYPDKVVGVAGHVLPRALSGGNGFGFVLMLCRNSLCRNKQYCKKVASLQEDVHALVQRLVQKACKHTDSAVALYYFRWVFTRSISADAVRSEQVWCCVLGLGSKSLAEGLIAASVSYIRTSQSWQSSIFKHAYFLWLSFIASVIQKWSGITLLLPVGSAFLRLLLGVMQCVWFSGGWVLFPVNLWWLFFKYGVYCLHDSTMRAIAIESCAYQYVLLCCRIQENEDKSDTYLLERGVSLLFPGVSRSAIYQQASLWHAASLWGLSYSVWDFSA